MSKIQHFQSFAAVFAKAVHIKGPCVFQSPRSRHRLAENSEEMARCGFAAPLESGAESRYIPGKVAA